MLKNAYDNKTLQCLFLLFQIFFSKSKPETDFYDWFKMVDILHIAKVICNWKIKIHKNKLLVLLKIKQKQNKTLQVLWPILCCYLINAKLFRKVKYLLKKIIIKSKPTFLQPCFIHEQIVYIFKTVWRLYFW